MSIWSDIYKRSNGVQKRKEDKFLTENEIKDILETYVVGKNDVPPIMMFRVLAENDDIKLYNIILSAIEHSGNQRNFYSEENVSRIMNIGGILEVGHFDFRH